jgi:nitroreductase
MNLEQAIDIRRSRRKYLGTPIDPLIVTKLQEFTTGCNKASGLRIEFVENNGKAYNGFTKSYGMLSGVRDYFGLIADKNDLTAVERLGYYGESLILHAVAMGLGTCWVGGSFSRSEMPFSLSDNESLVCTIVIGNTDEKDSFKENLIRKLTHRKTKTAEEMFTANSSVPDWFMRGMYAVQKAPSAINRQPVMFFYNDGKVSAAVKDINNILSAIDFGIAKLHFEIGCGGGTWAWGNNAEFVYSPSSSPTQSP